MPGERGAAGALEFAEQDGEHAQKADPDREQHAGAGPLAQADAGEQGDHDRRGERQSEADRERQDAEGIKRR